MDQQRYYEIKTTRDVNTIGNNFPSVNTHPACYLEGKNTLHEFKFDSFVSKSSPIKFTLANGSFFCDLMTQATIPAAGLLISEKLAGFLKNYDLGIGKHKYYPAIIYSMKTACKYFWLQFVWNERDEIVDYEKSIFYIYGADYQLIYLNINTRKDFFEKKKELGYMKSIQIESLKLKTNPSEAAFLMPFRGHIIVNQNLKNDINGQNFRGVDFFERNIFY